MSQVLIYGAYGYTGELIARRAVDRGLEPVLAGRDPERLGALGRELDRPTRVFPLDAPGGVDEGLRGVDVVIHAAGPFIDTYEAMAEACMRTGAHYLDITGEVGVFEGLARRDAESAAAGVMLLPGVGFDVVPSDCLAAHLARRLPGATALDLAISGVGGRPSAGTLSTMIEGLEQGAVVRRGGRLTPIRLGSLRRSVDLGDGSREAVAIAWGDVSSAYHSTGIPDIAVYLAVGRRGSLALRTLGRFTWLLARPAVKRVLQRRVRSGEPGPDAAERVSAYSVLLGEARDDDGGTAAARLRTPGGYSLTAMTAVDIAARVLDGEAEPGFRTPSAVFGPDYVLGIDGVQRDDLD